MPSLAVMTNFKKSVQMEQLASDAGYGALAAVPYAAIPSLVAKVLDTRMDGWKGWITAVLSTWSIGAIFDIQQFRSGAWTLGSMHLMYAYDVMGKVGLEMWRFDDGTIGASRNSATGLPTGGSAYPFQQEGLRDDGLQPGAQLVSMPDGSQYIAYPETEPMALQEPREEYAQPGMNDYFRTGQPQPVMAALNPFDEYASM
jgi:hypothetical protein